MMEEARDFRDESEALYGLLEGLSGSDYERRTQFKGWTISDVLRHLHMWNFAAERSCVDAEGFRRFVGEALGKASVREAEREFCLGLEGGKLLEEWRGGYERTALTFGALTGDERVEWVGPSMDARSSVTARLMETWSHGQAIYDVLGVERVNTDRLKSVAFLGVRTYGWTFRVRGEAVPEPKPYVRLQAPSGAVWEWNEASDEEVVEGDGVEFCQVVTQVRNVKDVDLRVEGSNARSWMERAQCFAGGAEEPPAPGTRYMAVE